MNQEEKKQKVAEAALKYVIEDGIIGIGTGSTVNYFIRHLATIKHKINGAVSSSLATEKLLQELNIPVVPLNSVIDIPVYIDGADEATRNLHLIKGGGGALTREKIIAAASKKFVCIIDDTKLVNVLGKFALPVEVIPMAQSYVGRQLAKLGGKPVLREGFTTDNGNIIIDVHNLHIMQPAELEAEINNIAGVVSNGIFAIRSANVLLVAYKNNLETIE